MRALSRWQWQSEKRCPLSGESPGAGQITVQRRTECIGVKNYAAASRNPSPGRLRQSCEHWSRPGAELAGLLGDQIPDRLVAGSRFERAPARVATLVAFQLL